MSTRGFFAVGIERTKNPLNVGGLWRSAHAFGAAFIFTIGRRYRHEASDTTKAWKHVPLYHYDTFGEFHAHMPKECRLVGLETGSDPDAIRRYGHPERAVYLLGAEDSGLSHEAMAQCHDLLTLPGDRCLNVAVAGGIALFDRWSKQG